MATIRCMVASGTSSSPIYLAAMAALASQYFTSDNAGPHLVTRCFPLVAIFLVAASLNSYGKEWRREGAHDARNDARNLPY
jgi:hypothetical protein